MRKGREGVFGDWTIDGLRSLCVLCEAFASSAVKRCSVPVSKTMPPRLGEV
jgi:hypothetical protein